MSIDRDLLLGFDVGGTKAVLVLARPDGEILAEARLERWSSGSWEADLELLAAHGRELLRSAGVEATAIGAIGVSAPGPLNNATGMVIEAPNLKGWVNVPVCDHLHLAFGARVRLENDANAAALAEWRFGAGRGANNLIYLTMSTGVGAGLILDRRLYRGTRFQSGEVGHMPIVRDGRACSCGLRGCLEAYTGGAAIAGIIREDLERGEKTAILDLAGGDPAKVSARLWCEALRQGDEYSERLRNGWLEFLSLGLAGIIAAFDPDVLVLGTIVQQNPDLFLDELTARVRKRTWPVQHDVRIVPGELGDRLPALAALCAATAEF
ncbi:MAG: ROK family protein [Deltaproteobacteria bacterium]|nr:ROK family protein [Deltaproteobacteria bacterium]MBW2416797.1 ROK family protein [Deltaproteobacteria bacterium]